MILKNHFETVPFFHGRAVIGRIRKLAERLSRSRLPLVSHFSRKCRMDPGGEIGRQTRRLPVLAAFDRPQGISVGCLIAVQF